MVAAHIEPGDMGLVAGIALLVFVVLAGLVALAAWDWGRPKH